MTENAYRIVGPQTQTVLTGIKEIYEVGLRKIKKDWCLAQFTKEEIWEAIQQMHPLKALRPDGLPALFFQFFWHIVGHNVQTLILDILNNRSPEPFNKTFIAIIPKCKTPTTPKDYRPISQCNGVMKIATKVIANRIKAILPAIIDEEQRILFKVG